MYATDQSLDRMKGVGVDLDEMNQERKRVLVVEDEPDTIYLLKQILRIAGFNVISAVNGNEALRKMAEFQPDLVLLDLMMPGMDGWQTITHLREMSETPVIIVSAMGGKNDIVRGLHMGADDYLTKPFHNSEVVARVQTVLRRAARSQELNRLVFPKIGLSIDMKNQEVTANHHIVQLTSREFSVLTVLARHAPTAVDYHTISMDVWKEDNTKTRNRTKYLVYLLRRKFIKAGINIDFIINVDRLGYRLLTEIQ